MSDVDINSYLPYAFYQVAVNLKAFPSRGRAKGARHGRLNAPRSCRRLTDQEVGVVLNPGPFPADLLREHPGIR
jgi:hypothetical protein